MTETPLGPRKRCGALRKCCAKTLQAARSLRDYEKPCGALQSVRVLTRGKSSPISEKR